MALKVWPREDRRRTVEFALTPPKTRRNEFLMGAYELREGIPKRPINDTFSVDMLAAMPVALILDYAGIRLNGPRAEGKSLRILWKQPQGDSHAMEVRNGALLYSDGQPIWQPDATLIANRTAFAELV